MVMARSDNASSSSEEGDNAGHENHQLHLFHETMDSLVIANETPVAVTC
jgi:hypothetical protein